MSGEGGREGMSKVAFRLDPCVARVKSNGSVLMGGVSTLLAGRWGSKVGNCHLEAKKGGRRARPEVTAGESGRFIGVDGAESGSAKFLDKI